ncbi:MAG TPA: matrixin family metalloprotease [Candidatus Brocadiia bacterium]|nr:matrixin family metalloprotease [Planctomycetota bacterium]MDO8092581.1 matrixin family metalloprotease [Candidatus Brocadiales bacterium]
MRSMHMLFVLLFAFCLSTLIDGKVNANGAAECSGGREKVRVFIHHPLPKKSRAETCTVTTNDTVSDYGLAGWHMPTGGVKYYVNVNSVPKTVGSSNALTAIENAFSAWTTASPTKIFTYGGNTAIKAAKRDGKNIIAWQGLRSAIAIAFAWYRTDTGQLVEVDTIFNKNYKWSFTPYLTDCGGVSNTFDVQNIATHEFGHWVGLDDLYDTVDEDLTMYGYGDTSELKKDTLGTGDTVGATAVSP